MDPTCMIPYINLLLEHLSKIYMTFHDQATKDAKNMLTCSLPHFFTSSEMYQLYMLYM